jgi:hypothetical protein
MSGLNRIHIHAPCVNWSAGISYPHSRACPLIGSFLLGFTYCDGRERESDRNVISRCSFIGSFLPGFHIVIQGTCFYVWLWYKRERTPKHSAIWFILGATPPRTNQIASCFGALSITYTDLFTIHVLKYPDLHRCVNNSCIHTDGSSRRKTMI